MFVIAEYFGERAIHAPCDALMLGYTYGRKVATVAFDNRPQFFQPCMGIFTQRRECASGISSAHEVEHPLVVSITDEVA